MVGSKKLVKCQKCGEKKVTRGEKYFNHCGIRQPINEETVIQDSANFQESDSSSSNKNNSGSQLTKDDLLDKGSNSKDSNNNEKSYNCGNCGASVSKGQTFCEKCGQKLNWKGV